MLTCLVLLPPTSKGFVPIPDGGWDLCLHEQGHSRFGGTVCTLRNVPPLAGILTTRRGRSNAHAGEVHPLDVKISSVFLSVADCFSAHGLVLGQVQLQFSREKVENWG